VIKNLADEKKPSGIFGGTLCGQTFCGPPICFAQGSQFPNAGPAQRCCFCDFLT